ncbi:MAG: TetR/AcrR family transcriptional regulator [Leptolyngbya sp.]|nr:TetR/AcrR family transcriptional regulator [Candidatus Melainabacteria bacterium]
MTKRQLPKFFTKEAEQKLSETSLKKRNQIIEAAIECFVDLGYEGTSMKAVAERAGVIKQTIYSHFENKEQLFKSVIQSVTVDILRDELNAPLAAGISTQDKLLLIMETILKRHEDPKYSKFFRTIMGETGRFPDLAKIFTEATIKPGTELVSTIFADKNEFRIPDPEAFARVFMGTIINYCMQQHVLRNAEFFPFDKARIIAELMRLVEMHQLKQ